MPESAKTRTVSSRERSVVSVPATVRWVLAAALVLQIGWHAWRPDALAETRALAPAPALSTLRVAALGDDEVLAKALLFRLLAHDRQPGVSLPLRDLDYHRVVGWLDAIIDLDPRADAPLLAAARVYGSISDPDRQRAMFELVHRRFLEDPARRWPWLAHAAIVAKHRLADPALALRYARAVTAHAVGADVPPWVRDMSAVIAADMGELDTARFLIGGLFHSGRVTDPREIGFLGEQLARLEARTAVRMARNGFPRKPATVRGSAPAVAQGSPAPCLPVDSRMRGNDGRGLGHAPCGQSFPHARE